MSRSKLRRLGRYDLPAPIRPPLGDRAAVAATAAGYTAGLLAQAGHDRALVSTVESVATATRTTVGGGVVPLDVAEASSGGAVKGRAGKPAEITIDIIRSGWNTSGSRYYPADVLERDVPAIYPAGTHMFVNHPTATEQDDRPERSLHDLAAVFTGTPYAVQEGNQTVMRVDARVYSRWCEFIAEARDDIGVSINGNGAGEWAEREGRHGMVLERLTQGQSVDFVTKAGAGGRIVALFESARALVTREAGTLGAWLESRIHLGFTELADGLYGDGRLTRDERITASGAVGDALGAFVGRLEKDAPQLYQRARWSQPDGSATTEALTEALTREAAVEQARGEIDRALQAAYGGEHRYAWVHDFDPDAGTVWFAAGGDGEGSKTWQQAYTRTAGTVTLTGDRVEVRARTVYEPVTAPAATTTTEATAPVPGIAPGGLVDLDAVARLVEAQNTTSQTPAGGMPAGDSPAPEAAITTKGTDMGDKTADVVAREAAEARESAALLKLAQYEAGDTAAPIIDAKLHESELPAAAKNRVKARFTPAALPLLEANRQLDTTKLTTTVEAAIIAEKAYVAEILESAGVGRVTGVPAGQGAGTGIPAMFGGAQSTTTTEAAAVATQEALVTEFKSLGLSEAAAMAAAAGRR